MTQPVPGMDSSRQEHALTFTMQDGRDITVPLERLPTPPPQHVFRDHFTTLPERRSSTFSSQSETFTFRAICLDCAERARHYYDEIHAEHVVDSLFERYTTSSDESTMQPAPDRG